MSDYDYNKDNVVANQANLNRSPVSSGIHENYIQQSSSSRSPKLLFPYDTSESLKPIDIRELEEDPKSFLVTIWEKTKRFFSGKASVSETSNPVKTVAPSRSRSWIEQEIEELKALIEADLLNIDNFVHKLTQFTSLLHFHSGQIELDEVKVLQESLKKMLQEQKQHYNNWSVFVSDVANGAFSIAGGIAGLSYEPPLATAVQTVSQGGQSVSKILGNGVEREKAQCQHLIEFHKSLIEQIRTQRSMLEQQSTKMDDHRTQVNQLRGQIVGEINR